MRRDRGTLAIRHPFVVEFDLGVDQRQRVRPARDVLPHAGLMRAEQGVTLRQRGRALLGERAVYSRIALIDMPVERSRSIRSSQPT